MLNKDIDTINFFLLLLLIGVLYSAYRNNWLRRKLRNLASDFFEAIVVPIVIVGIGRKQEGYAERILRLFKYYHPIGNMWLGSGLCAVVSDPETIETLLKKHLTKGEIYEQMEPYIGHGLFTAPADIWKMHRKLVNLSFSQNMLNSYLDFFRKNSQKVVENLRSYQNTQINIFDEVSKFTVESICDSITDIDIRDVDPENECIALISSGSKIIGKRLYNPLYQFQLVWKLFGQAKEEQYLAEIAQDYGNRLVNSSTKKRSSSNTNHLLNVVKNWSDKEILDEVLTLAIGACDPTAITTCFFMLMVAIHQDIQDKVYQEQFEIFGNSERDVDLDDLVKMTYLDRVMKETLRLFPVGPVIMRRVQEDVKLGNYTIPKGRNLVIPTYFIHRNPMHWPNPSKFDPDRFLPEEVATRPRYSYMAFGIPPRNCIGRKYADMSMKVMLSTILRHFKVFTKQYDSVGSINLNVDMFLTAANGYGVTLVPRSQ